MLCGVLVVLGSCGGDSSYRVTITDERGDASPGYLDVVEASVEFGPEEIVVEITVAEPFPSLVDVAASWQVGIVDDGPQQYWIAAHLVGSDWRGEVARAPAPEDPPIPSTRFAVTPPTGRTLRMAVPAELVPVADPEAVPVSVSTSGEEGTVDTAHSR